MTIVIIRDGSTSVVIQSPPPLKNGTQYFIASVLTMSYHPQKHFVTWEHFNTRLAKRLIFAKTRWSCNLVEEIHNTPFNPKSEWENNKLLMGGETSHYTAPRLIQMRLPSGRLTENDEDNVSVFASHLKKCSIITNRPKKQ